MGPLEPGHGDLAEEVAKLKQRPGKNILIPGSPTLARSLLRDGLLDELSLAIAPIVVGSGMRLFDEITDQVRFTLVESRALSTGVLAVRYQQASPQHGRPVYRTDATLTLAEIQVANAGQERGISTTDLAGACSPGAKKDDCYLASTAAFDPIYSASDLDPRRQRHNHVHQDVGSRMCLPCGYSRLSARHRCLRRSDRRCRRPVWSTSECIVCR